MITIINWSTALSLLSRPNLLARNVRMTTPEINKKQTVTLDPQTRRLIKTHKIAVKMSLSLY